MRKYLGARNMKTGSKTTFFNPVKLTKTGSNLLYCNLCNMYMVYFRCLYKWQVQPCRWLQD